jgi:hypothetical protein
VRKKVLILLTFIGGLYYFLLWVMPLESRLDDTYIEFGKVTLVVSGFAFLLGVTNLVRMHGSRILRKRPGYYNSVALIVALFAMALSELLRFYTNPAPEHWVSKMYQLLFFNMRVPIDSTIFSLLAFYMASAAYRAFRIKSVEAGLMMVVAVVVMLGEISVGNWLTSAAPEFLRVEHISEWLKKYWNAAAQRGILFGALVGALALSMRIWLSLERGSFFDRQV